MRQRLRSHLTYANVMVTVLAFVVLTGGTAVALSGSNTVFTDDIVDNQVYSADVRNDGLPGGGLGHIDLRPNSVGSSEVALDQLVAGDLAPNSVGTSEVANNSLTGADLAADEAPHVVGTAGEPTFGNGGTGDCLWQDFGPPFNPVSFYRGKDGRVHLAGVPAAQNGTGGCGPEFVEDQRIFTLPPAYRPANVELFTSRSAADPAGPLLGVLIGADQDTSADFIGGEDTIPAGAVIVLNPGGPADLPQGMALDGLDFRAAGTGGF